MTEKALQAGKEVVVRNDLMIPIERINVPELFSSKEKIKAMIAMISKAAHELHADISTATGRKAIASNAYAVARSKTFLDDLGKEQTADWRSKVKSGDALRKLLRDGLDQVRDEVRQELTDYETAEKERIAREKAEAEKLADWDDAIAENDLFDRQREIERKEAELRRQDEERKAKEEAERLEQERKEREERIAREAEEMAKRKAAEEKERLEREKREAEEAAERAEQERIAAAKQAEIDRQNAVKEAEAKAEREAERKEQERLAKEQAEKEAAERKARHHAHRKRIQREAVESFLDLPYAGVSPEDLVDAIDQGLIKHVSINY